MELVDGESHGGATMAAALVLTSLEFNRKRVCEKIAREE